MIRFHFFYLYLFLSNIYFLSCHSEGKTPFYFPNGGVGESPVFRFSYGKQSEVPEKKNETSWMLYEDGVLCLFSLPFSLYQLELGAKFQICLRMEEKAYFRWKEGFASLENRKAEYPHFFEVGNDWQIRLTEFGKWQKERENTTPILEWKHQIWSTGLVSYQVFALPHPLFLQKTTEECEVVFRTNDLSESEKKSPAIVFTFSCPDTHAILESIQIQNDRWFLECQPNSPVGSEVFRHSESSYGRYLEWENPTDEILCPRAETLEWEDEGGVTQFQSDEFFKRSRLILPHGILLLSDEGKLQGIPIPKLYLSSLGTRNVIRFGETRYQDSKFSFRQGDEFFSSQTSSTSCRDQWNFWKTKENFCGNPGIPNALERIPSPESLPHCSPEQIYLTEFYPGNQTDSQFPFPGFFEFQNRGTRCDLSGLNWIFDDTIFPFSTKETILEQDALFLFVRKPWTGWGYLEKEKPFSLPQLVFQIPSFLIQTRKTKKTKTFLFPEDHFHLLRNTNSNLHSIYQNEEEFPHPREGANSILLSLGFQMSPGTHKPISKPKLGGELLEFSPFQFPFFDFGFHTNEEGVFSFRTESSQEFFLWKPKSQSIVSFTNLPSVCNGDRVVHLPDRFFSGGFPSLFFQGRDGKQMVHSFGEETLLQELSKKGVHSLHPEDPPIFFSASLHPSPNCSGYFRTPGAEKVRSLEIRKSEISGLYHTNASVDKQAVVQWGNQRFRLEGNGNSISPLFFQLDLTSFVTENQSEQIYSYFSHPNLIRPLGFLERIGPVQIEAIYPNPYEAQNEWVYLCNRSQFTEDLRMYRIEDEVSSDPLVPYQTRFPGKDPKGKQGNGFVSNESLLAPGQCAWIVDPDGKDWYLPIFHKESDLLLTVSSTQTIGNGISSGESVQLRKEENGKTYLISSFGHPESAFVFRKTVVTGEYIWLKQDREGTSLDDYETFREEN
ncbi:LIC11755 family lipoprotein [Leptospira kemamanensis]|uniref:LIC11755 family lipoprotein n=1 Tax=Leptospira kemamanensis TaxID=2484942 RepID=UPI001FC90B5E|nr:hypothetical protein [Leptospira kemamanensis]